MRIFKNPWLGLILLYSALVVLAVSFSDWGWYEPDGIAILAGSINLPEAKSGNFFLYNYYYQPLTYELNHLIYRLFHQPYLLYLLPALCGSLAVCLMAFAVYQASGKRINLFFSFCLLLFFPEIFYRLLYPNSSVFGMAFFASALLLLFWENLSLNQAVRYALCGILAALTCLFRLDFLLGIPAILFIISKQKRILAYFLFGFFLVFITAFLFGIFKPLAILEYYKFHLALIDSLAESQINPLAILFSITNIIVWIFLGAAACIYCKNILVKKDFRRLWIVIPVAVLFSPVFGKLVAGHYLMAAICFGPIILAIAAANSKRWIYILVIFGIVVQFINPYHSYALTHDGPRFFGAYLKGYQKVKASHQAPYWRDALALSHGLADLVSASEKDFVIVGAKEEIPENYLLAINAYSLAFFLQVKGYALSLGPEGMILKGENNQALIQSVSLSRYRSYSQKDMPRSAKLIKLPLISRQQLMRQNFLKEFWQEIARI